MKENNKTLIAGLVAVLSAVGIVALVGLFAIRPQKEAITGEADATEYRISNMVPGHIDQLYVADTDVVALGNI